MNTIINSTQTSTKTCVAVEPCKVNNADAHNFRQVELLGIRRDLTSQNIYKLEIPAAERYLFIKREYARVVGQRMQPRSHPIIEIVVVGIKTKEQAEKFAESLEREFHVKVLSFAVHLDEGHFDPETGNWIANYHAHFVVDRTIWSHELIRAPKKRHGKIVRDQEGNIVFEAKDRYARQIRLGKQELSRLQDIAAEVTGLERGTPSTIKRLRALQYKYQQIQKDIAILLEKQGKIEASIVGLNQQREDLEEENHDVEESLKGIYDDLKGIGETIIGALDSNKETIQEWVGPALSLSLKERRDNLESWSSIEPEQSHTSIAELVTSFAAILTATMLSLLAIFKEVIEKMKRQLAELKQQILKQSIKQSAKGFITTWLDKPANEQMRQLATENQALRDANAALEAQNSELLTAQKADQRELFSLRSQVSATTGLEDRFRTLVRERTNWGEMLDMVTSDLITKVRPDEIIRLEYLGLPTLMGQKRWEKTKTRILQKHAPKVPGAPQKGGPKK